MRGSVREYKSPTHAHIHTTHCSFTRKEEEKTTKNHFYLDALEVHFAVLGEIAVHARKRTRVQIHQQLDGTLADLQRGQVRQKIVTDEKAQQHKVVNGALKLPLELDLAGGFEVQREVLEKIIYKYL